MAQRKVLVLVNGEQQQLQSGDYISAAEIPQYTNGESGSISICMVAYVSANDTVKKAKADASGTMDAIGIVADATIANGVAGGIQDTGTLTATTTQWDAVAGTSGGLTAGVRYFVSAATAGSITATAPTAAGQYVQEVGIAVSTTELKLTLRQHTKL